MVNATTPPPPTKPMPRDARPLARSLRFSSPSSSKKSEAGTIKCVFFFMWQILQLQSHAIRCARARGAHRFTMAAARVFDHRILDRRELIYNRRQRLCHAPDARRGARLGHDQDQRVPDERRGGRLERVAGRERHGAREARRAAVRSAFATCGLARREAEAAARDDDGRVPGDGLDLVSAADRRSRRGAQARRGRDDVGGGRRRGAARGPAGSSPPTIATATTTPSIVVGVAARRFGRRRRTGGGGQERAARDRRPAAPR